MKEGKVLRILIAKQQREPLIEVSSVLAKTLEGLDGDRYGSVSGSFSQTPKVRDVTLISEEAFRIAVRDHGIMFTYPEARRNIVVSLSVSELNALVGKHFRVGEVSLYGTELCDPCKLPARLIGRDERDFILGFKNAGGIRARIGGDGVISLHARITAFVSATMLPECP